MRIQCDSCEKNTASVMCCADEAALCTECDARIHAANKLANKHARVSLHTAAAESAKCDICQVRCSAQAFPSGSLAERSCTPPFFR